MFVYVLVFWDSARIKIFNSNKKALDYLIKNNYKNFLKNNWTKSIDDFEIGKYVTLFNKKIE